MPRNVEMGEDELIDLLNGGGLSKDTEAVRARQYGDFDEYVKQKSVEGVDIEALIEEGGDAGKASVVKMLGEYFFSMRVLLKDGKEVWPKKGYASRTTSSSTSWTKQTFQKQTRTGNLFARSW